MIDARTLQRLRARWRTWRGLGDLIKRRVAVEQYLLDCAAGKRDLPSREECRTLALKLGTPTAEMKIQLPKKDGDQNG